MRQMTSRSFRDERSLPSLQALEAMQKKPLPVVVPTMPAPPVDVVRQRLASGDLPQAAKGIAEIAFVEACALDQKLCMDFVKTSIPRLAAVPGLNRNDRRTVLDALNSSLSRLASIFSQEMDDAREAKNPAELERTEKKLADLRAYLHRAGFSGSVDLYLDNKPSRRNRGHA